jgi:adenosylhomocysteinase
MSKAAKIGDIFITATGNTDVIRKEHLQKMKSGTILANSGHFNVEINIEDLNEITTEKRTIRDNLDEYVFADGRKLYLLADGRLVNLAAAEGHPSEVMDMSFANQALSVEYLVKNKKLSPNVHPVPKEIDESIAKLKLEAMKIRLDDLTDEQKKYLAAWEVGT